jgi:hypothetical protein
MTELHPITPPPDLLKYWEEQHFDEGKNYDVMLIEAYQEGADMELQACCKWIEGEIGAIDTKDLFTARRPKPLSLKTQAMAVIENSAICDHVSIKHADILRRALEALDD